MLWTNPLVNGTATTDSEYGPLAVSMGTTGGEYRDHRWRVRGPPVASTATTGGAPVASTGSLVEHGYRQTLAPDHQRRLIKTLAKDGNPS